MRPKGRRKARRKKQLNRKALVKSCILLAHDLAWKFNRAQFRRYDQDELSSIALAALAKAGARFKIRRGRPFLPFAKVVINRALTNYGIKSSRACHKLVVAESNLNAPLYEKGILGNPHIDKEYVDPEFDIFARVKEVLTPKQFRLVRQRFVLGIPLDTIAKMEGVTRNAIRNRIEKVCKVIAEKLPWLEDHRW
jgi:RNA polymerase sigma factor (sigma-70 family)